MKVKLNEVRIAFINNLFTPAEYKPGDGKPRYSSKFVVVPGSDNHKAIEAAIAQVAAEAHGVKSAAVLSGMRGNGQKYCYLDGSIPSGTGKVYNGFDGMMALSANRRAKDGSPVIVDRLRKPLVEEQGIIYGGCFVNASVDIYIMKEGNPGVFCTLMAVQFVRDGDAFSGSRATADDFDDLADTGADLF